MKLYTLEYDCNLPTVQQINVPTNSDFKVGIKVIRNGEVQDVKAGEVAIDGLSATSGYRNGYVLFDGQTEADASLKQSAISVDHEQTVAENYAIQYNDTGSSKAMSLLSGTAEELGLAGKAVNAADWYVSVYKGTTQPTETSLRSALSAVWGCSHAIVNQKQVVKGRQGTIFVFRTTMANQYTETWKSAGLWTEADGPVFFFNKAGTETVVPLKEYTFEPEDIIDWTTQNVSSGQYLGFMQQFKTGVKFSANFKLNVNTFKSQAADVASGAAGSSYFNFSGQFADGTDFDYDVVVK